MTTERGSEAAPGNGARRAPANAAQLRGAIEAGETGDKVAGFDPAAAPLGTDAEAGGARASPEALRADATSERAAAPTRAPNAAEPELSPDGRLHARAAHLWPAALGVLAALVLAALLYLLLVR